MSKAVSELQNHLGVVDKNLAEFTIAQRLGSDTFETFKKMSRISGDFLPQIATNLGAGRMTGTFTLLWSYVGNSTIDKATGATTGRKRTNRYSAGYR